MVNKDELLIKVNQFGLEGKKLVAWIPPVYGSDNPDGTFVVSVLDQFLIKGAGDK